MTDPTTPSTEGAIDVLNNLELMEVEEIVGPKFGTDDAPKIKTVLAIGHVLRKRSDPTATWESTLAMPLEEVSALVVGAGSPEPSGV